MTVETISDEDDRNDLEVMKVTNIQAAILPPRTGLVSKTQLTSQLKGAGEVSTKSFEQRFVLKPFSDPPIAVAGDDQVVFDSVTLNGDKSSDPDGELVSYEWELFRREGDELVPFGPSQPGVQVDFNNLTHGFYEAKLTVTDEAGDMDADTVLVAAAGACEDQGGSLPAANGKLHLWRFKVKKYKYCNWAFARVYGTVDASDLPLDSSIDQDGLKANVILQIVDNEGNAVGEWSAETAAEIKDRRYKYVIQNKW